MATQQVYPQSAAASHRNRKLRFVCPNCHAEPAWRVVVSKSSSIDDDFRKHVPLKSVVGGVANTLSPEFVPHDRAHALGLRVIRGGSTTNFEAVGYSPQVGHQVRAQEVVARAE